MCANGGGVERERIFSKLFAEPDAELDLKTMIS